ncbi:flagellar motor protein MotB [Pseudogracilibacillus sp. SE30717A]|uniref:flagellar motor protein MotB n=1 Tax=Pseudogracilibacillus sp. SE30717A TaxID=3098293 RepID=UPI00300E50B6
MSRRKRNKDNEAKTDESWLLPYADMLTLLLALFIVLFAMSEIDVKKFEQLAYIFKTEFNSGSGIMDQAVSIVPEKDPVDLEGKEEDRDKEEEASKEDSVQLREYEELKAIQESIETYIATNSLTETLGTKLTSEGLLITVRTDITFDSGSAKVKKQGIDIAKEIAAFLNTDPPHEVVINGHADDRPVHNQEYASNWELSSMRAIQFMYLLLDNSDVDPKYFSARGYGEFRPVVENNNEKNRAINRRVEVLIQPNHNIEEEVEHRE